MDAFDVDLFLTTNLEDARNVIDSESCAAAVLREPPADAPQVSERQVRIAFDGDAVLFSEESEVVYTVQGIDAFQQMESEKQDIPLKEGPYASFFKKLAALQKKLAMRERCSPIRIALVTSRNALSDRRVMKTFRWRGVTSTKLFSWRDWERESIEGFQAAYFFR